MSGKWCTDLLKAKAVDDIKKHIDTNWKEYSRRLGLKLKSKSDTKETRNDQLKILLVSEDDYPAWKKLQPWYIFKE